MLLQRPGEDTLPSFSLPVCACVCVRVWLCLYACDCVCISVHCVFQCVDKVPLHSLLAYGKFLFTMCSLLFWATSLTGGFCLLVNESSVITSLHQQLRENGIWLVNPTEKWGQFALTRVFLKIVSEKKNTTRC